MPGKTIELEGFGRILLNPINIRDKEHETVDSEGNALTQKTIGTRAKTVYVNTDGAEIPSTQVCKKFEIEGEELIVGKMMPTSKVEEDDIEEIDDKSMFYDAIEKKVYVIFTESPKLKELILKTNKSLKLGALVMGLGWKAHEGILTSYQGKIILACCRGKLSEALTCYNDDTVELELDAIEDKQKAKKMLKAIEV